MALGWPAWFGRRGVEASRWLVLDVESSGLDPTRDRLLAIAAIAVQQAGTQLVVRPGDSFEVVLRQPELAPDKANILVHGIGVGAQRAGVDPAQALQSFVDFAGDAPLVAFHAAFDRALIERAMRGVLGRKLPNAWLDLADLAPVLRPEVKAKALDEWLAVYGLTVAVRHQAAADTLATAELFQKLWPLARAQGADGRFASVAKIAAARRWMPA